MSELADTCLVKVKEVVEPLPLYCAYDVEAYWNESGLFPINEILVTSYFLTILMVYL